jgi:hypothetical protein
MTTSYDTINTLLEVSAHAAHVVVARTTRKRSLTQNEPWHWYMEWRLCVLTTAGRDAILPYYESPADQNALFGERPTIVQERRVDVAPDGALKERAWDSYNPFRTPWEAIWRNGTGIIKADESLHPFHAFVVERWQRYSALTSERQQLVTQRDRVRPPDLNTRQGQRADQQAFNARGEQALKDARLYTKWVRAQSDSAARTRLQPQVDEIAARVRQEHAAEREQRLAEVARLSARIEEIDAEIPWLCAGRDAPRLLESDTAPVSGDAPPTIDSLEALWAALVPPDPSHGSMMAPWMRSLGPGAHVVLTKSHTAPVWYAQLVAPPGAEREPTERDAQIFSAERRDGRPRAIRLAEIALLLTPEQFAAAREAHWPDTIERLWTEVLEPAVEVAR